MAEELLNSVLSAIKQAHEGRRQRLQMQFQQDQAAREQDYKQQQIELEHQRLDQQQKQFDTTQKAAKAMHDLQVMNQKNKIAADLQAGNPVVGDTLVGTSKNDAGEDIETHDIPGVGQIMIPSHGTLLKRHLNDLEQTVGPSSPAARAKIEEEKQKQEAEGKRLLEQRAYEGQIRKELKASDDARAALDRASREHIAQMNNYGRIQAASMRIQGQKERDAAKEIPAIDPTQYFQNLLNGTMTRDDVIKEVPNKKQAQMILNDFTTKLGGVPLNVKQKEQIQNFKPIADILPKLQEYNQILQQHELKARLPGTDEYKNIERLQGEIEAALPNVARFYGDVGRLSNQQMQYAKGGFIPDKNIISGGSTQNVIRLQDFTKNLAQTLDSKLAGLPDKQRAAIKQNFGLLDLGGQQQQQPLQQQQQQTQPSGNIHWERDPQTGKLVQVQGGQ